MKIDVIILAAGKGTRMGSNTPKVLSELASKPLLQHVIDTCSQLSNSKLHIVVGVGKNQVKQSVLTPKGTNWISQNRQLGTGHAVKQALKSLRPGATALIMYGDVPLVNLKTLKKLVSIGKNNLSLLTFNLDKPKGYGRILRRGNKVAAIVEEKDASTTEKRINEVNSGIISTPAKILKELIPQIKNKNSAKEYYLTDVIQLATENKISIKTVNPDSTNEVLGANDKQELQKLERAYHLNIAKEFIKSGVNFADTHRVEFRGKVTLGKNSFLDINVIVEGESKIGKNCFIGAGAVVRNSTLGDGVRVEPYSVIENSSIGEDCKIGPFAHIGPEAWLDKEVEIGNYVEVKRSKLGSKTKAKHLAYIGDGEVGSSVNIGAGTIFVNYDGKKKHKTKVGSGAFIGSNSALIAPLQIGKNSMIGAGSVVTENVPENKLALGRSRQRNLKIR